MLRLDYDLTRGELTDDVKMVEVDGDGREMSEVGMAGVADYLKGQQPRDVAAEAERQKEEKKQAEAGAAAVAERKKEPRIACRDLAEKRLDLEDAERAIASRPARRSSGDRPSRGDDPTKPCRPVTRRGREPTSREYRIGFPSSTRVPGDPTASCWPRTAERGRGLGEGLRFKGASADDGAGRVRARFVVEKIGEKVDPARSTRSPARANLVHRHQRDGDLLRTPDRGEHLMRGSVSEIVFIDKDHLSPLRRRGPRPRHRPGRAGRRPGHADAPEPAADSDLGRRMTRVEEKLDRILKRA